MSFKPAPPLFLMALCLCLAVMAVCMGWYGLWIAPGIVLLGYASFVMLTTEVRLEPSALLITRGNTTHTIPWPDLLRVDHVITHEVSEHGSYDAHVYRFVIREGLVEVPCELEHTERLARALAARGIAFNTR